jgi:hypothetical protein
MSESARYYPRDCVIVRETDVEKEARRIASLPQPTNQIAIFRDSAGREISFDLYQDAQGLIVLDSDLAGLTHVRNEEKQYASPPVKLDAGKMQRERREYIAQCNQGGRNRMQSLSDFAAEERNAMWKARQARRGLI